MVLVVDRPRRRRHRAVRVRCGFAVAAPVPGGIRGRVGRSRRRGKGPLSKEPTA
jgi:hypothetical protein